MAVVVKPFKYVGGKSKLLEQLLVASGVSDKTSLIVEPFAGSAVFGLTAAKRFQDVDLLLSDWSEPACEFFAELKEGRSRLIRAIKELNSKIDGPEAYLKLRQEDRGAFYKETTTRLHRAARYYIILYRGYNGLYRVNSTGGCNTPYGGDRKLPDDLRESLTETARALQQGNAIYAHRQFDSPENKAAILDRSSGEEIFVLLDPPYRETFVEYTAERDKGDFYDRLLAFLNWLDGHSIPFIMTNSPVQANKDLFAKYHQEEWPIKYSVAADGTKRTTKSELIVSNYKLPEVTHE